MCWNWTRPCIAGAGVDETNVEASSQFFVALGQVAQTALGTRPLRHLFDAAFTREKICSLMDDGARMLMEVNSACALLSLLGFWHHASSIQLKPALTG